MPGTERTHSLWTGMECEAGRTCKEVQGQNLTVLDPRGYELENEHYLQFLKLPSVSTSSSPLFPSFLVFFRGRFPDGILQAVGQWIRFISYQIFNIPPSFVAKCLEMFAFQR